MILYGFREKRFRSEAAISEGSFNFCQAYHRSANKINLNGTKQLHDWQLPSSEQILTLCHDGQDLPFNQISDAGISQILSSIGLNILVGQITP